jgi:hypothetical protein
LGPGNWYSYGYVEPPPPDPEVNNTNQQAANTKNPNQQQANANGPDQQTANANDPNQQANAQQAGQGCCAPDSDADRANMQNYGTADAGYLRMLQDIGQAPKDDPNIPPAPTIPTPAPGQQAALPTDPRSAPGQQAALPTTPPNGQSNEFFSNPGVNVGFVGCDWVCAGVAGSRGIGNQSNRTVYGVVGVGFGGGVYGGPSTNATETINGWSLTVGSATFNLNGGAFTPSYGVSGWTIALTYGFPLTPRPPQRRQL